MRWITMILVVGSLCGTTFSDEFISDAAGRLITTQKQAWGNLGLNTSTVPPDGRPGMPLQVAGVAFEKGLGSHANGEIVLRLGGEYQRFLADFGVQFQGGGRGSVVAEVWVDGVKRFESPRCTDDTPAVPIDIPLEDAQELKLLARDGGDGISCDLANWCNARLVIDPARPKVDAARIVMNGTPVTPSAVSTGFSFIGGETGPQAALLTPANTLIFALQTAEGAEWMLSATNVSDAWRVTGNAEVSDGAVELAVVVNGETVWQQTLGNGSLPLEVSAKPSGPQSEVRLTVLAISGSPTLRWNAVSIASGKYEWPLGKCTQPSPPADTPAPTLNYRPGIEQAWIEWDWRLQDGIGTARAARTYAEATELLIGRGNALLQAMQSQGIEYPGLLDWQSLCSDFGSVNKSGDNPGLERLWRRAHDLRRKMVFSHPLAQVGPLLFVKQVPSSFSHQLTQYYGRLARPGGGLFALDAPGQSMQCRPLSADTFPAGSFMQPDVSYDGTRVLFAYTEASPLKAGDMKGHDGFYYHLYEMLADGTGTHQLTDGAFDDFAPRYLPDGRLLFTSTRRGGFHRCGSGPCPVYTLTRANADGSDIHSISYHETQEWDPAVLNDGRIIYTRWDYVDRNAVHYQQLWTTHPNGEMPLAYYGNNTFNPVGIWEARAIPGSDKVMATAAAHHAMTAGSIVELDVTRAVDGMDAITRLTPDAPFPESETSVLPTNWHAPGSPPLPPTPVEAERWPGHCYRSPNPLSEDLFLVAYSYDALIAEPSANPANMFGLYLADRFGNKELLYRDANISSLWPVPLRSRPVPPAWPDINTEPAGEGTFFVQNVYETDRPLPEGAVKRIRVLQVLPKTTPNANQPRVGLANASPGKQVLGTVPVEADGSALFKAPAGIPLLFQALDDQGRAVQTMRSVTYLQPGERAGCVGCHDHRLTAPKSPKMAAALEREASAIEPGPDGSRPLSYPILVQPVLDKLCVHCHDGTQQDNKVQLTGTPQEAFTVSYNTLITHVPFPEWSSKPLPVNSEPATQPGFFGARASKLMDGLLAGHHEVVLAKEDRNRLITWMDANALFYGTFKPEDQALQQKGERIAGPALE